VLARVLGLVREPGLVLALVRELEPVLVRHSQQPSFHQLIPPP